MTIAPVILASGSPRRRQLLNVIGMRFEVAPADIDETPAADEKPAVFAVRAAREKAQDVAGRYPDRCVLGADTVVEVDGEILGKPRSTEDAARMLRMLSGRSHLVHTALALVNGEACSEVIETATVEFVELPDEIIRWYVATEEALDKAGAYAVQGIGGILVSRVDGSPQTVIGLPIHRLPELFKSAGLDFWETLASS